MLTQLPVCPLLGGVRQLSPVHHVIGDQSLLTPRPGDVAWRHAKATQGDSFIHHGSKPKPETQEPSQPQWPLKTPSSFGKTRNVSHNSLSQRIGRVRVNVSRGADSNKALAKMHGSKAVKLLTCT